MELFDQIAAVTGESQVRYTAEQEQMAKQMGFRNAQEMVLFEMARQRPREQQTIQGQSKPKPKADSKKSAPAQPAGGGFLGGILGVVTDALAGRR